MRLRAVHIGLLAAMLVLLCGCGRRARVIPAEKLTRIYHDMFLADQWIRDTPDARKIADTTLFFDPIFRKYGYSFEDYDRSVNYYLDHTEQYSKILSKASERLRKEGERMQREANLITAREVELAAYRRGYKRKDFSTDSLRWSGPQTLWPVYVDPAAEEEAVRDTLSAGAVPPKPKTDLEVLPEGSDTWEVIKPMERSERDRPRRIRIEDMEKKVN